MKMYEIQPAGELDELLKVFYRSGGVINYVLIGVESTTLSNINLHDLHTAAALFTVKTATGRYWEEGDEEPRIEPEKMDGSQIEPDTFFHVAFGGEAERNAIIALLSLSCTAISDRLRYYIKGPYVWKPQVKSRLLSPGKRKKLDERMNRSRNYEISYFRAFSDPPYWFKMSQEDAQRLFREEQDSMEQSMRKIEFRLENLSRASRLGFRNRRATDGRDAARLFKMLNHHLFGDDTAVLSIYEWDCWGNSWADYFDAGQEWWGSFLWTVYNSQTKTFVGIAASSTD